MEDFSFDFGSILTDEESKQLFEGSEPEEETPQEEEPKDNPAEEQPEETPDEPGTSEAPEGVGREEDNNGQEDANVTEEGTSPNMLYPSIAEALVTDGILPDLDIKDAKNVTDAEKLENAIEQSIKSRFDERQRRIDEVLEYGMQPKDVNSYEQMNRTLEYLQGLDEDSVSAEGDEADELRRNLIYNDYLIRKFTPERAKKKMEQSFSAGSDIDDAKDALESLTKYYGDQIKVMRENAKKQHDDMVAEQKKNAERFNKMIFEEDIVLGDVKVDKATRKKIYDAVSQPVYKDPQTKQYLTEVQQYQREHPLEFLKFLGTAWVLTEGGKNIAGFVKPQVKKATRKGMQELERKINSSSRYPDGSLKYVSGVSGDKDPLLNDGWKIGLK